MAEKDFMEAYSRLDTYPFNLVPPISHATALAFQRQLKDAAPTLLLRSTEQAEVRFLDLFSRPVLLSANIDRAVLTTMILSDEDLQNWLWDDSENISEKQFSPELVAAVKTPKFRFIFLCPRDSRGPLTITQRMLLRIMTFYQVMPSYIEFLTSFGAQISSDQLLFGGFRELVSLSSSSQQLSSPILGRSGRMYQMAYNLRRMTHRGSKNETSWSMQQVAIYHQFDIMTGAVIWIVTSTNDEFKRRVESATREGSEAKDIRLDSPAGGFKTTLAIHMLCVQWSEEEWRWHFERLKEMSNAQMIERFIETHASIEPSEGSENSLRSLRLIEEQTQKSMEILESNHDVIVSLDKFYDGLRVNHDFSPGEITQNDIVRFSDQLRSSIIQNQSHINSARSLMNRLQDKTNEIREARQSKNEALTQTMHERGVLTYELGVLSRRDAVAMKIITVVTLIYLPATFVSTFFSTDIVKYQGTDNGSFSNLALYRWLQVTLPLTVITLTFAFMWFKIEAHSEAQRERQRNEVSSFAGGRRANRRSSAVSSII